MPVVMTNLRIRQEKVQLRMAELYINPYDLCSKAGISYATYRRIMKEGGCKIATLGKLAQLFRQIESFLRCLGTRSAERM